MTSELGPLRRTLGYIWECGDPECRCEQAVIVEQYENPRNRRFIIPVQLWEGSFVSRGYGWDDDDPNPDLELASKRRELRAQNPDLEARITWQEGIDYGV